MGNWRWLKNTLKVRMNEGNSWICADDSDEGTETCFGVSVYGGVGLPWPGWICRGWWLGLRLLHLSCDCLLGKTRNINSCEERHFGEGEIADVCFPGSKYFWVIWLKRPLKTQFLKFNPPTFFLTSFRQKYPYYFLVKITLFLKKKKLTYKYLK